MVDLYGFLDTGVGTMWLPPPSLTEEGHQERKQCTFHFEPLVRLPRGDISIAVHKNRCVVLESNLPSN